MRCEGMSNRATTTSIDISIVRRYTHLPPLYASLSITMSIFTSPVLITRCLEKDFFSTVFHIVC